MIVMRSHGRGYTLIEILIALCIVAILAQLSVGGFSTIAARSEQRSAIQTFISAIERARRLSVTLNRRVLICSIDVEEVCAKDWDGKELAAFIDSNENRLADTGEELVYRQPWNSQRTYVTWSNWLGDATITYQPNGTVVSNGTLVLSDTNNTAFANLVINKGGRVRLAPP
jgi:type IV fimbrial biogenesis protein FimT